MTTKASLQHSACLALLLSLLHVAITANLEEQLSDAACLLANVSARNAFQRTVRETYGYKVPLSPRSKSLSLFVATKVAKRPPACGGFNSHGLLPTDVYYSYITLYADGGTKCLDMCANGTVTWCVHLYHPTEDVKLCLDAGGLVNQTAAAASLALDKVLSVRQVRCY